MQHAARQLPSWLIFDVGQIMKSPRADEVVIEGRWVSVRGKLVADEAALRIDDLTTSYFEFVGAIDTWSMLYRDPKDGRLWEQTYPESQTHGGGPPKLAVISSEEARQRYSVAP